MSEVKSFFPNIEKYYKKTDLIICRAGGSTIAEILYLKIPCIIIPLKNSMDDHQAINCKIINDLNDAKKAVEKKLRVAHEKRPINISNPRFQTLLVN